MATFFRTRTLTGKIIECCTIAVLLGLIAMPFFASGQTATQTTIDAAVSTNTTTDTVSSDDSEIIEETVPVTTDTTVTTEVSDTTADTSVDAAAAASVARTEDADTSIDEYAVIDEVSGVINDIASDVTMQEDFNPAALLEIPENLTGSVTVCKVVLDANGSLVTGTAGSNFSIDVTDNDGAAVGTATFDAPLTYDTDLFTDIDGNDAQCQTFSDLPLLLDGDTTFHYSTETTTGDGAWEAPRYSDTLEAGATLTLADVGAFDADASADGTIVLPNIDLSNRVVVVVNQMATDETETPVVNMCIAPDTLGDDTKDAIQDSGESTVQEILDDNGYGDIDATDDQRQYQLWHVTGGQEVTVSATFLDKYAGHSNVFGYYTNGDVSTFVPLFRKGSAVDDTSVPEAADGSDYTFTVPDGATTLGFMIKSYDGGTLTSTVATEAAISTDGDDNVVAYNPSADSYILGFEDLIDGDYDFNDMVVVIHMDCTDADSDNNGDGGGNGGSSEDVGGTGGGSLQCVDGLDNDGDGLIDDEDPGCHTDNDATNNASYDPTDDDESDEVGGTVHVDTSRSSDNNSSSSVPATPEVLGASTCGLYLTQYIKLGHNNDIPNVTKLQLFLNDYMGFHLPVNGTYDLPTFAAVKQFQLKEQPEVLTPWVGVTLSSDDEGTGWVYKTTKRRINMIMCPELNLPMPELTIDPQDL